MDNISAIENIELNALLECIFQHCGYDFRHYARASLRRNIQLQLQAQGLTHISELIPMVLHQPAILQKLLQRLSINVTEFFRDPPFFKGLIERVFPVLKTFPFFKVWHAGCASGEEVYSLAILLQEAGLLERARIYATDFNHTILAKAKGGIYPQDQIERFAPQYHQAGGKQKLQNYFHSKYNIAKINSGLRNRITFAHHNLVTDGVFGEMQLIVCRNVLIYFDKKLKQRVLELFYESLYQSGFLCLGTKESLEYLDAGNKFDIFCSAERIYKKVIPKAGTQGEIRRVTECR